MSQSNSSVSVFPSATVAGAAVNGVLESDPEHDEALAQLRTQVDSLGFQIATLEELIQKLRTEQGANSLTSMLSGAANNNNPTLTFQLMSPAATTDPNGTSGAQPAQQVVAVSNEQPIAPPLPPPPPPPPRRYITTTTINSTIRFNPSGNPRGNPRIVTTTAVIAPDQVITAQGGGGGDPADQSANDAALEDYVRNDPFLQRVRARAIETAARLIPEAIAAGAAAAGNPNGAAVGNNVIHHRIQRRRSRYQKVGSQKSSFHKYMKHYMNVSSATIGIKKNRSGHPRMHHG